MNEARYFLPHLLALSTSSPFWMGRDTGLKSYRTTVFRRFPRTGIPDHFDSWSEYEDYVEPLVELHCIDNGRRSGGTSGRIRRSARSSSASATCRRAPRATIAHRRARAGDRRQALPAAHAATSASGSTRRALIEENKWRAARWGIDGKLIDFGKRSRSADARARARAARVRRRRGGRAGQPAATSSTCTRSCADGTSADRQLRVYRETGDLRAVVQHVVDGDASSAGAACLSAVGHECDGDDDEDRTAVRPRVLVSAGVPRSRQHAGHDRTASPRSW